MIIRELASKGKSTQIGPFRLTQNEASTNAHSQYHVRKDTTQGVATLPTVITKEPIDRRGTTTEFWILNHLYCNNTDSQVRKNLLTVRGDQVVVAYVDPHGIPLATTASWYLYMRVWFRIIGLI